ncbi:MAG: hypothetical protein JWQ11_2206 [Rhizobacter sp.]|nr:hypothetical protein [Rhizobacter sp.]
MARMNVIDNLGVGLTVRLSVGISVSISVSGDDMTTASTFDMTSRFQGNRNTDHESTAS